MAYMAQLDNDNVVTRVLSVSDANCPDPFPTGEAQGAAFLESLGLGTGWKQTSYNANGNAAKRYNYAGIGYTYDAERDAFIAPQPFPSWVLNETTCSWEAPIPYPSDGGTYVWDEDEGDWVEVTP
jgi:hypothetical protein